MIEHSSPGRLRRAIRNYLLMKGWRPRSGIPAEAARLDTHFCYDEEKKIREALAVVADYTMISFERAATLWQQVRYLDRYHIEGSLVECGVWKGGAIALSALAHLASVSKPERHLHLFDSFQGLPEPDPTIDGEAALRFVDNKATGVLRTTGKLSTSIEYSQSLLRTIRYPDHLTHYHVGWFQDTLQTAAEALGNVALLRLDGDWYDSTAVCLRYLYPRVVKFGIVVIDDYGHFEGCRRAVDDFLTSERRPILLNHIDYTARYFIKPA